MARFVLALSSVVAALWTAIPNALELDPRGPRPIDAVELAPADKTIAWGKKILEYRAELTIRALDGK